MTDYVVVARVLDGSSAHEFVISRHANEREHVGNNWEYEDED